MARQYMAARTWPPARCNRRAGFARLYGRPLTKEPAMAVRIGVSEALTRTLRAGLSVSDRGAVRVRLTKRLPGGLRVTVSEPLIRGLRRR